MITFDQLFPGFVEQCQALFMILVPVAVVLIIAGLVSALRYAYTPRSMLRPIVIALMITMAIGSWGEWTDLAQEAMKETITAMDANPQEAAQRYTDILVSKENPKEKDGWFGLPSAEQMYEAILWGILSLIGILASVIFWAAYIIQRFLVGLAYAFAPVFLGFLALRSTSLIGVRYILGTVGIIAWPLGWAAASIGTSNLIDLATNQEFIIVANVYGLQTILAAAVIGGWIIITTFIAPVIIQSALATGASVGAGLLSGATTAGASATGAATQAGAAIAASRGTGATGSTAAGVGGSLATGGLVLAGAGAAAGVDMLGSAMRGGGGGLSGSAVGAVAPLLRPAHQGGEEGRSAKGDGSSDGRSSGSGNQSKPSSQQSAPVPAAPRHQDLTNDEAANRMIEQSHSHYEARS